MDYLEPCYYSSRLIEKLKLLDTENKLDFPLINKAIYWAKKYHDGQFRKSGEPFYTHPIEVALLVIEEKCETNIIIAALLHDLLEDTEITFNDIKHEFDDRIAYMVERVTRIKHPVTGIKPSVWDKILEAWQNGDNEANLIKSCDRQHNLSTLQYMTDKKQIEIINETIDCFFYINSIETGSKLAYLCFANMKKPMTCNSENFFYLKNFSEDSFQLLSQVFQND